MGSTVYRPLRSGTAPAKVRRCLLKRRVTARVRPPIMSPIANLPPSGHALRVLVSMLVSVQSGRCWATHTGRMSLSGVRPCPSRRGSMRSTGVRTESRRKSCCRGTHSKMIAFYFNLIFLAQSSAENSTGINGFYSWNWGSGCASLSRHSVPACATSITFGVNVGVYPCRGSQLCAGS